MMNGTKNNEFDLVTNAAWSAMDNEHDTARENGLRGEEKDRAAVTGVLQNLSYYADTYGVTVADLRAALRTEFGIIEC